MVRFRSIPLGSLTSGPAGAVYSRCLSALKEERGEGSKVLKGPRPKFESDADAFVEDIRQAPLASKIVSYAQG